MRKYFGVKLQKSELDTSEGIVMILHQEAKMYSRILIATDGSDLSFRGVQHGLLLARALKAKSFVLRVAEAIPTLRLAVAASEIGGPELLSSSETAVEEEANTMLAAICATADSYGIDVEPIVLTEQTAVDGILAVALRNNISLIVMASHGRKGWSRLLLGSHTDEVITRTDIPVLVVK